jgi:glutamine amidotransferase
MTQVSIVDYQTGNLGSVAQALETLGVSARIISTPHDVGESELIILPGQGAIGEAMAFLRRSGLDVALTQFFESKKPVLGICLGMQMMMDFSEEDGGVQGLGWVPGVVKKITAEHGRRVPHMGWNSIHVKSDRWGYFQGQNESYLYFAHSYYVEPISKDVVSAVTDYEGEIVSAIQTENVFGVQPHPEKSGEVGLAILKNFLRVWNMV